ncbi:hypothetical protein [Priestia filamentosa]|uniref:hypothetical protein n=1 Tax=Priestia filamentosa TaxID=1402861 RepID=UPI000A5CBAD3|nr:hypothetical protein [Priestia filamentosa]
MKVDYGIEVLRQAKSSAEYILRTHCYDSESEKELMIQLEQLEASIKKLGGDEK